MKRVFILLVLVLSSFLIVNASDNTNWSTTSIPSNLLVKANAVLRNYEKSLRISANGEVEEFINMATTILNENGERYCYLVESYDKYSSISDLDGVVFDKNGKKIRKIRNDEFVDISAIAGFSIYDDNRLKVANPKIGDYPYTVVYSYKKKHKSFFAIPGWQIYPGYNIAVQKTSLKMIIEQGAKINYKGNNRFNIVPTISDEKGKKIIFWNVENQPAIEVEPLSESFSEFTPLLQIAPEKFIMDNFEGSNTSWRELGDWAFKLGKNRNELPEATKAKIKGLIAEVKTEPEKAKILYEYLQNKVRYVSIQVGIGGFQPFPAETVDRLSYGDCKALTNYMKSLLDVAGIKSYYCLVKAGEDSPNIDKNFVCSQFNHAFLMLPFNSDTLYLECTSQKLPFGYNGTFTDDRDVLVIDSTASYLKHTNIYDKDHNKTINSFNIKMGKQLDCDITQKSNYIGVASESIRYLIDERPEKQRENVLKRFQLRQVKISKLSYNEIKDVTPIITENIEYYVPQIAQITNNSAIVPFNQVTLLNDFKRVSNRKSNIVIQRSEAQIDTITYLIPQNLIIEKLPNGGSFKSSFGKYDLQVTSNNGEIKFIRKIEWNKGNFNPELYNDLIQYQRKVNEMDRQVIMMKIK